MKHLRFLLIFLLASCQYFQPKVEDTGKILAEVDELTLSESDIEGLIPKDISKEDSISRVEKFILDWVKKQLMIREATKQIDFNQAEINNKVLDYRYALMIHEYEQAHIAQYLNESVSEVEIEGYYNSKGENFILRENLAKVIFVKVSKKVPNLRSLRRYTKSYPADSAKLFTYVDQYAEKSFLEDSTWVKFDEVLLETPLYDLNDKKSFLEKNSFIEVSDENFTYIMKILDKRTVGDTAPLDFIRNNIVEIIINKRKINLIKELEKRIYDEAVESNAFKTINN